MFKKCWEIGNRKGSERKQIEPLIFSFFLQYKYWSTLFKSRFFTKKLAKLNRGSIFHHRLTFSMLLVGGWWLGSTGTCLYALYPPPGTTLLVDWYNVQRSTFNILFFTTHFLYQVNTENVWFRDIWHVMTKDHKTQDTDKSK